MTVRFSSLVGYKKSMKTLYVIRNTKTGRYYDERGRFTALAADSTWVMSKAEAKDLAKEACFKRLSIEIVPVQLLRV